jgi:hypothetical protein
LTPESGNFSLLAQKENMPENIPMPGGAVPPKPAEAAKVQPKKETVRINLPPKPTSAPTIKLPTLAQATQATSSGTAATAAPRPAAPPPPPAAAPPPPPPPPPRSGGAAAPRQAAAPAPVQRPAPYVAPAAGVGMLDNILAILAVLAVLAAVGSCLYLVLGGITGIKPN